VKGKRKTGHYEIDEAKRNYMELQLRSLLNFIENGSVSVSGIQGGLELTG